MQKHLNYKNHKGSIEFSKEDKIYFGKLLNITDLVLYEGSSIEKLKANFIKAVDSYNEPNN
ncbi:antitoxin HicB [Polaribacter sp. L3A8]|uniref:antitoxin HicB n=1 Tax=Polaribacter sp. L3A8 TaxID=2686361 RepID=UPI00131C3831|nr:antitoxin HicB [Polaribacter sp. L3A8]